MTSVDKATKSKHQWTTCPCGKRGYPSRAGARKARQATGDKHMAIYRCDQSERWHIGHRVPGLPRTDYYPSITRRTP